MADETHPFLSYNDLTFHAELTQDFEYPVVRNTGEGSGGIVEQEGEHELDVQLRGIGHKVCHRDVPNGTVGSAPVVLIALDAGHKGQSGTVHETTGGFAHRCGGGETGLSLYTVLGTGTEAGMLFPGQRPDEQVGGLCPPGFGAAVTRDVFGPRDVCIGSKDDMHLVQMEMPCCEAIALWIVHPTQGDTVFRHGPRFCGVVRPHHRELGSHPTKTVSIN